MRIVLFFIFFNHVLLEETYNTTPEFSTTETTIVTQTSCDSNDSSCKTSTIDYTAATTSHSTLVDFKSSTQTSTLSTIAPSYQTEIFKNSDSNTCTCNLQRKFCDINCCCDMDCSFDNKKVFKTCKRETNIYQDTSFCQYFEYIYLNNTPYKWEINQNGLFCIAKTNLPPLYVYQRKEPILSLDEAEFQKEQKFSWPNVKKFHKIEFNSSQDFVYESEIWIMRNKTLGLFQLPDSFVTGACLIKQSIKFLRNYKTKCSQTWIDSYNSNLSPSTYFHNITFIKAPSYFNISLFKNKKIKNYVPIDVYKCEDNYINCFRLTTNYTLAHSCKLDLTTNRNSCINVVKKVKYNLYHNGTAGLTKIHLFLVLQNFTYNFGDQEFQFMQEFQVNYFWSNYTFSYGLLLSGNPGYLITKPILMANVIFLNKSTENTTKEIHKQIRRNPYDVADTFLVIPASKGGLCVLSNASNVITEFGYNVKAKCKIRKVFEIENRNATALCRDLKRHVFDFWPISKSNHSSVNRVVGSFGNANESLPGDWIDVLSNKSPVDLLNETFGNYTKDNRSLVCSNFVTSLKIDVFHARVDFKDLRNQEKIFGVVYRFEDGAQFEFNLDNDKVYFEVDIREEIVFVDISGKRIEKFAEHPPLFKITLPYDFFYPFVKVDDGGVGLVVCNFVIVLGLLLVRVVR